ncbi:glycogen synthase GlgA [Chitinimonas lacunae]|uniref:Glycogen synthase n=1 Tax=Chitinimonas lacunae TaxID=1963018 RepID=A0ABV8MVG6_9NEIS
MAVAVLHVAAECYPLLKTGGLADVVGALPAAQRALGADVRLLLPGFPTILDGLVDRQPLAELPACHGARTVRLWFGHTPDSAMPAYALEAPGLYDRSGNPYQGYDQRPYDDNHRRFALLGQAAARLANEGIDGWRPTLLHGHDWHAGLMPAYLRATARQSGRPAAASVFTVHNLAYQGLFPAQKYGELGLPDDFFAIEGLEFYGQFSFLKAGLFYSDRIATVSPSYAREIQTPEFGCGLDGLLRWRATDLCGILNGVDQTLWNPAADTALPTNFDAERREGKRRCKALLQQELGLEVVADAPLFAVVSRLTEQKGLHRVLGGAVPLLAQGGQLCLLGSGEPAIEAAFKALAQAHPGRVAVRLGFDEALSHRLFGGADVVLVPSRFEPCGLTQLYALRYGALPLVRRTGGLADTVRDASLENLADDSATGFVFERCEQDDYDAAVRRAFTLYRQPAAWDQVQRRAMCCRFGWDGPAEAYLALYRTLRE